MNFTTSKTSTKLRFLARALRRKAVATIYNQCHPTNCVVGIGARLNEDGTITESYSGGETVFIEKYGVTEVEADGLFLAEYGKLRVGLRTNDSGSFFRNVTAKSAADVVDKLAAKYAARGK